MAQANDKKLVIGGKPVTFRMMGEDDQADPKTGTTVAQKLVDAKVAAVIGHLNSGVTIPASEIYTKAGIPVISGAATNPTLTEPAQGRLPPRRPATTSRPGHRRLHRHELKRRGRDHRRKTFGEGPRQRVEKSLKGKKVAIVGRERTTDKETDFKAILTKIKAKNPDVVFHGGMDATGGPMLKQARELGIKSAFSFGDGACTNEMAKLAGAAAEGLICSQAGLPAEAASAELKTAFNAKYGESSSTRPILRRDAHVIEAMKKADTVDPAKFMPEMYNVLHRRHRQGRVRRRRVTARRPNHDHPLKTAASSRFAVVMNASRPLPPRPPAAAAPAATLLPPDGSARRGQEERSEEVREEEEETVYDWKRLRPAVPYIWPTSRRSALSPRAASWIPSSSRW